MKEYILAFFYFFLFILITGIFAAGLNDVLFFIPKEWGFINGENDWISYRFAASSIISILFMVVVLYKYEKLSQNQKNSWKK